MDEQVKQKILDFLKKWQLAVISTIHTDRNAPESAVVAFTEMEDLTIIIGTSNTSRKYKNMVNNPNVSLVIGWDSNIGTVQIEGTAREITEDVEKYSNLHVQKNPGSKHYVHASDQTYFLITPTWIRFLNNANTPPQKYEKNF